MAETIARAIGATLIRPGSNEAMLDGKHTVIKSGRLRTRSVGVSKKMLPKLDTVVAAFQRENGSSDVFSLDAQIFKAKMTDTRSRGRSAGKVGIVSKPVFVTEGQRIGAV